MKTFKARIAVLCLALAAFTCSSAIAQVTSTSFSGILTIMWGDPKPGVTSGGEMRFELTLPDGTAHPLQVPADQQSEAVQYFGKRVTVEGRMAASANGDGPSAIAVDNIMSAEPPNGAAQKPKVVTRKVLFVLLKYKGDSQKTHPVKFYTNELTNPKTPPSGSKTPATINGFFDKTSWGNLQWNASVAGKEGLNPKNWFTLPKTKSDYAPCGWTGSCANLSQLRMDALHLLDVAGVNWKTFDNINFVVNNDLDCCAWGGSFSDGVKVYGQTFEPPWSQEASTYVHEMGHSIGLPHSGWRYYAYDSHHDEMSRGHPAKVVQCGTYKSANDGNAVEAIGCTEPGAGYITAHKDYLGWLPTKNRAVVDKKMTHKYVIEATALPLGSRIKMVKICIKGKTCDGGEGSNARFVTVEAKIKAAKYENGLPSEGIVIHDVMMSRRNTISGPCFFNNQNGWAVPIDATPGDFNTSTCSPKDQAGTGLVNMPYKVGKTYKNSGWGISVKVLSKTKTTYTVEVKRTK